MHASPNNKPLIVVLYLNAGLLAALVVLVFGWARTPSFLPAAFAQNQSAIGGGAGVFIVPGQFSSNVYGFYVMDVDAQTVCAYAFEGASRQLRLVAARNFRHDRRLGQFNTGNPTPDEVEQILEQQQQDARVRESEKRKSSPEPTSRE